MRVWVLVKTPCVAYDVAGLRDSVRDGETGVLVPSGDVKALANAIIEVLVDGGVEGEVEQERLRVGWKVQLG